MLKKSLVLLTILAITSFAVARHPEPLQKERIAVTDKAAAVSQNAAVPGVDATSTCSYQFTSGGTATKKYLQYCVTVNGNIVEYQSPSGVENIAVGIFGEGYAVCDFNSSLGYHDYAGFGDTDTGSWGPPSLLTLNGTTVKIARTTSDGIWTLTQTIQQSPADATVKLTMALKNNTAVSRFVWLTRYADVDAHGTLSNTLDGTHSTAFGYFVQNPTDFGLQLSLAQENAYAHEGWAIPHPGGNAACSVGSGFIGTVTATDGSIYLYHGITIGGGKTATVKLKYSGM